MEPANLAQASADIERWRKLQERNAINIPVKVDERQISDAITKARKEFDKASAGGSVLKLNLAEAGFSLIPGAVTGLVDLAGALQQVAQAGLVIPGALAGAGASISTMVVGLSGVKDAYDAVAKAAQSSGVDQAAAARAATQAQNQLRNAAVDDANAHKDLARAYRDARQELEDLNIEARGGKISEEQAINDALKARRDLAKGGFKDQLDYNDALLRVESADQRVVEVHQRNIETQAKLNDENSRGIDNSDKVVAAQERVVRSGQQVADAQTSVDMATTKSSAAATAAAQAMAKLGPNAQELVNTLVALQPVFQEFRTAISQPLLQGMSGEIHKLIDADLPILQQGMARIAAALNLNFKTLGSSLGSANSQGLLDRILGNTAQAQKNVNAVIDPLVRGLGALTAAGSDALPRLADDFAKIAEHFATLMETADKDGRLDKWINDGLTGFGQLASTLEHLGSSFLSITRAAGGGSGLLGSLDKVTGKLAEFLKSDEGQQKLRDFFQHAREDLEKWEPILKALPGFFTGVLDASREWINVILPPIAKIADTLGKYPGLLDTVLLGFTAFKTLSFASNVIGEFDKISNVLGLAGGGKKGEGGKGLLGKLSIAAALLGALAIFDASTNPDGSPKSSPAAPGMIPTDQGPIGAPVPAFTGAPVLPSGALGQVAGAAVGGATMGGAPGAAVGALATLFTMSPDSTMGPQEKLNALIFAIPSMPESDLRPIADAMGLSVDQLKGLSRDDFKNRLHDLKVPGFAKGGPTPSGRGNGPSGGWMAEVHSNEWVLPAHARAAVGDKALWALTSGRSFGDGGYIDPAGNPVTPGAAPGPPADVAPVAGPLSGAMSAARSFIGGLTGSFGSAINGALGLGTDEQDNQRTPTFSSKAAAVPGLWGLNAGANGTNPEGDMTAWTAQTGKWLGQFGAKTLSSLGSTLYQGGLASVGLQNSILSPSNPYVQSGMTAANFFADMGMKKDGLPGVQSDTPSLGTESQTVGDNSVITTPTYGTSRSGGATTSSGTSGVSGAAGMTLVPGQWQAMDALAAKYGLVVTPEGGYRPANGPTIAGVPAAKSYHASGRAHDYSNGRQTKEELAFATYIAQNYGSQIKELIFDYPGFGATIKDGRIVGPFGSFYTMAQAGDHSDHVHVAYATGGAAKGQGGPHDDLVPAWLSSGEHVLTAEDVSAMGGQENVYKFRNALHRAAGGGILSALIPQPPKPNFDPGPGAQKKDVPNIPMPTPTRIAPSVPSRGAAPLPPPEPAKLLPEPVAAPGDPGADVNSDITANKPNFMPTTGMGAPPSSSDHALPALSKGIQGAASVIGSMVSMAASAAAAGGSMGASAMAGGMGGSQAGALASGLITEGGKIATGIANVASSFLVGNITSGTTPNASGDTLRPYQNVPITSPGRTQVNTFNGMDVPRVFQELDLRNSQDQQAQLAHRPVR